MTFCTFNTQTLIPAGTIVKKANSSVVANDGAADAVLVGVVIRSYSNEENTENFAEIHLGGGVTFAKLSSDWDGTFNLLSVNGDGVQSSTSGEYHGYLIPELPPVSKNAGDIVPVYWRGAT